MYQPSSKKQRSPSSTGAKLCSHYAQAQNISPSRSADNLLSHHVQSSDSGYVAGQSTRRRHPLTRSASPLRYGYRDPSYATSTTNASSKRSNNANNINANSTILPIPVAVLLWYLLGVVSIATSKILLSTYNVPPLVLTVQQLIIGMTLLRTLLEMQTSGEKEKDRLFRRGVQPIPIQQRSSSDSTADDQVAMNSSSPENCEAGMLMLKRKSSNDGVQSNNSEMGILSSILALIQSSNTTHIHNQLFLAGIYFAAGFLLTNQGFKSGSAAFVETVKAAEPFTSATVAVLWGIEQLGKEEIISLAGIVLGVVLSTFGNRGSNIAKSTLNIPSSQSSLISKCMIVMASNSCFSFRGLHQKLFRGTAQGHASMIDDLNLQYRMQQIGVILLIIPTILLHTSFWALSKMQQVDPKQALHYISLSIINGLAFTSYNLSSTYVLTRISVVHHAALNCIRRVFAIIVTSLIFGLSITILQVGGIALAVTGFFCYVHFKIKKETKDKKRKELRKKWGGIMKDAKNGKWSGKSSSLLPE